jgi:hypothetical protein
MRPSPIMSRNLARETHAWRMSCSSCSRDGQRDQGGQLIAPGELVHVRAEQHGIDWSQNNAYKTTVAPYSLRARESPTASTPVSWDEAQACRRPEELFFTAGLALDRVARLGDLFAPLLPP